MRFTFRTRNGNYYTISLTIFIVPVIALLVGAIVIVWASVLQGQYQSAFDRTYAAITERRASITVPDRSTDRNAVIRCAFSTPELFTVDRMSYRVTADGVQYVFIYNAYMDRYEENLKEYNGYIDAIAAGAPAFADDGEAVRWIHDYIIRHYEYGGEHSVFSMLRTGRGVCSAYTALFTALADRFGLEHSVARSDKMDHTWNMVRLDGNWYHLDVTWDDLGAEPGYEYYLKTSEEFLSLRHHDWVDTEVSLSTYAGARTTLLTVCLILFGLSVAVTFIPFLRAYFKE